MKCEAAFVYILSATILSGVAVATNDVNFAVRNRQRRNSQDFRSPLDQSKVNPRLPFKFIVHGWVNSGNCTWIQNLSYAFLERRDYNVIAVNWHNLAQLPYTASAHASREVGNRLSNEVIRLHSQHGVSLNNIHLIGHSLGAQIVGFAGKEIFKATGNKVARVTGLDPAGPLFENPPKNKMNRLSDQDGTVVEIIHTDGGVLGFLSPLGTIDFYPNGGKYHQPGCIPNLQDIASSLSCSHMLSTTFYVDAVRQGGVTATKCASWSLYQSGQCNGNQKAKYGAEKPPKERGVFYNAV